jgi:hypothetical protein
MVINLQVLIALVGLGVYVLPLPAKASRLGEIVFFCAFLALMLSWS